MKHKNTLTRDEVLARFSDAHGNLYDYSSVIYKGEEKKIEVICRYHGIFETTPKRHWNGAGCRKCKGLAYLYPELLKQWHPYKNNKYDPETIGAKSHKTVWWKCSKGHAFQAKISQRTSVKKIGQCPICSGKKITPENNLKARFPKIYKQWHPTKNVNISADTIAPGSTKKVWWLCTEGHEYDQSISSKTLQGRGCPICAGQRAHPDDNVTIHHPDACLDWDYQKNKKTPEQYKSKSNVKVWWKCSKGHEYFRSIQSQTGIKGSTHCPYCSGVKASPENNIMVTDPHLISEWHPEKNEKGPKEFLRGAHTMAWWLCPKGHEYEMMIYARTLNKSNCPYCSGRYPTSDNNLLVKYPEIAKDWHPTKNKGTPEEYTPSSTYEAWWVCEKGHSYQTKIGNRTPSPGKPGTGCPKCTRQSSAPEFRVLSELRYLFDKVISRYMLRGIEADIFIPIIKLAIEYDGAYFHKKKEKADAKKSEFFKRHNIKLIRLREKPLKKIRDDDILIGRNGIEKKHLNILINYILRKYDISDKKFNAYLKSKRFLNDDLYRELMSYFPSPIPENSILFTHPRLVKEWDYEKNSPLRPENFSKGSEYSAWWLCPKGHSYDQNIGNRTRGSNCPYCSGQRVGKDNNLVVRYPNIASEWHPSKNGGLRPEGFMPGTHQEAWWLCPKGHSYKKAIGTKVSAGYKRGCPKCAGLGRTSEEVIKKARELHSDIYDYSKLVYKKSSEKFTVICKIHGPWQTTYHSHISVKRGCPKCAGWGRTSKEVIKKAKEVHGNTYDYSKLKYKNAKDKFKVICRKHGVFETSYHNHIRRKSGCPQCSHIGRLRKPNRTTEDVIREAKLIHGDTYDYSKLVYINTSEKFTVICKIHGPWEVLYNGHVKLGNGCRKCLFMFELNGKRYDSMSDAARQFGINIKTIDKRLRSGWSKLEAFEIEPRGN